MHVVVTDEERQILIRWKKRGDSLILIRLKAEAILYASHGVDLDFIAEMVRRTVRTVKEWLAAWRASRLHSVVTGHKGNQNAAKLTREQKEQLNEVLSRPPSESGVKADFWDVPALADVVRTRFDVEYDSEGLSSILCKWCGLQVGIDALGVGQGELLEGLFPVGGHSSLDQSPRGSSLVGR